MPSDDLMPRIVDSLDRIDAHIERGNELFARNIEAFERNREAFERTISTLVRVDRRLDRMEERDREQRTFMREVTERHVSMTQHLIGVIQTDLVGAIQSGFAELQAEIRDQREQIQANTRAVLELLDRFGPADAAT